MIFFDTISSLDLTALGVSFSALAAFFALYQAALSRTPMKGRLKKLERQRSALKAGLLTPKRRQQLMKDQRPLTLLRLLADKLKLLQNEQTQKIAIALAQAGHRSKDALLFYQTARLVLPLLAGALAVFYFYGLQVAPNVKSFYPIFCLIAVLFGLKLPEIFITNQRQKRLDILRKSLPDALDLLVVCAEAGLSLDASLARVAREMRKPSPVLAEELELTSIELGFLPERRQALMNLADRVPLATLRSLITALSQSERYGTPLAAALRLLSREFRNERLLKAEEKAARLPAILTIPLILFILPVLFIVLLGPASCRVVDGFINRAP